MTLTIHKPCQGRSCILSGRSYLRELPDSFNHASGWWFTLNVAHQGTNRGWFETLPGNHLGHDPAITSGLIPKDFRLDYSNHTGTLSPYDDQHKVGRGSLGGWPTGCQGQGPENPGWPKDRPRKPQVALQGQGRSPQDTP